MRPPPRYGHHLHLHNDQMYLLGGFNDLSVPTTTLFQATMSRQQVDRACALACAAAFGEGPGAAGGEAAQQGLQGPDSAAAAVAVGPNSSAAQLQLSWQELEAELPYNKSRATVMQQGQLRCYQLGSATLGRSINEDDAEKGVSGRSIRICYLPHQLSAAGRCASCTVVRDSVDSVAGHNLLPS